MFRESLSFENWQVLTPYRTGYYGTLGINKLVQSKYRIKNENEKESKYFRHGDKIIRLCNWYSGKGKDRKLKLSNGSMGIVNSKWKKNKNGANSNYEIRKYYFKDTQYPLSYVDDEENFDLAYAISVHKSQGSDFKNVFLIVPRKESLLSKELLYTALTRSKFRLFIFVQETDDNLLLKAKNTSHLIQRNTSVFTKPESRKGKFSPEPGVTVASKIEFIIYQALQKSGLKFKYEEPLELDKLSYKIHPDFTIFSRNNKKIFWEHLGMLDMRKYYNDWQARKNDYNEHGYSDVLITTDDLNGVKHEKIAQVIEDIKELNLKDTTDSKFSKHHYELY
jgi:exodeoxyribonuclease V alpha subunit